MRRYGVLGASALLLISTGVSAQQAPAKPPVGSTDQPVIQMPAQSGGSPAAGDAGRGSDVPSAAIPDHCHHSTPTS